MMKMRIYVFVLAGFLIMPSLIYAETVVLKNGKQIKGDILKKTDDSLEIEAYGSVMTFPKDTVDTIDNKTWEGESVSAALGEDLGFTIPEEAYVRRRDNGTLEYVEHKSDDITVNDITFPAGTGLFFDNDGKLKESRLSAAMDIKGIHFPEGSQIYFSPEGNITSILSRDNVLDINGLVIPEQTPVYLRQDGSIERIIASGPMTVQGKDFSAGAWIFFDEGGQVK